MGVSLGTIFVVAVFDLKLLTDAKSREISSKRLSRIDKSSAYIKRKTQRLRENVSQVSQRRRRSQSVIDATVSTVRENSFNSLEFIIVYRTQWRNLSKRTTDINYGVTCRLYGVRGPYDSVRTFVYRLT